MLQRRSQIFRTALLFGDAVIAAAAWTLAHLWAVRFSPEAALPPLGAYLLALFAIVPLWIWVLRQHGLYTPRRIDSPFRDLVSVVQAGSLVTLLLIGFAFLTRTESVTLYARTPPRQRTLTPRPGPHVDRKCTRSAFND